MARLTLPGHTLLHGGSALDGDLLPTGHKEGPGSCECGESSEVAPSNGARRAWHRAHLAQLRAEIDEVDSDPYA